MGEIATQDSGRPSPSRRRSYASTWWTIVVLFPLVAAVVLGAIHAGYRCNIEDDDVVVRLLTVELILLPSVAATFGALAGKETLASRGRSWAVAGALGGVLLSLAWGAFVFWTALLFIADAAC